MFSENIYKSKMLKALEVFNKELSSLRTGRANANMLDLIKSQMIYQTILGTRTKIKDGKVWETFLEQEMFTKKTSCL